MKDMSKSYDNNSESEKTPPSGMRASVVSLTEEALLERVDYETMLEEIRI